MSAKDQPSHTATPYHVEYDYDDDEYTEICDSKNEIIAIVHSGSHRSISEDHANAEFIVRACNAYSQAKKEKTKVETKHTVTPWEVRGNNVIATHEAEIGIAKLYDGIGQNGEANAEHIVKCVNAHDALVGVCGDMLTALKDPDEMIHRAEGLIESIESALRLAGEGE